MRYAFRSCRKNAGFSAAVVLIVSLAVGGSATVFSIFNAALLRPLPYRDTDRVVIAWEKRPKEGSRENGVTPADYLDWRARNRVFASLTAHDEGPVTLTGNGKPERLIAVSASTDMLATYGVEPLAGRGFAASDEKAGGRVALLSYGFWQRHFGASRSAIGGAIQLDEKPFTIVGVLPQNFRIYFGAEPDVFIPLVLSGQRRADRGSHDLLVIGRLRSGIALPEAQADMTAIGSRLEKEWPKANTGHGTNLVPIDAQLRDAVRPTLLVLTLAVLFVLLIACANVANLTLARGFSRQRELAVREVMGAGRMRLVRLLLAESFLLSGLGGALGCGLAFGMLQLLKPLLPKIAGGAWIPGMDALSIDRNVLLFIVLVSALSGLLFGIVPAWRFSKSSLHRRMKDSGRLREVLIVAEASLSCILLTGATLLLTSFLRLSKVNPGFQAGQRISMEVTIPPEFRKQELEDALYRRMLENTEALPAVRSAALTNYVPGFTTGWRWGLRTEAHPEMRSIQDSLKIWMRVVSPGFVSTMGIPIIAGRSLAARDIERSEPVVLLSETAARRYLPGGHAIGQRIALGDQTNWRRVVGIVGSVKHLGLSREAEPEIYVPLSQSPMPFSSVWLIAHFYGRASPVEAIRQALASTNASLAIGRVQLIEDILTQSKAPERFNTVLVGSFAALSLLLAAAGIYSVLAFLVARQTREIGIRMALGAQRTEILRQYLRRVACLALLGICIGTAASLVTNGLIRSFLFGVTPSSPIAYATASIVLFLAAMVAAAAPAWRAARVDPMIALREE
jgi:putative ABC transport system permease protein